MKISLAQTRSLKGDILANVIRHIHFTERAASLGADLIVFPELSLTGYEPTLAKDLATIPDDPRLDALQAVSDVRQMVIGAGLPTSVDSGVCISMVIFQPGKKRIIYSKKYLHADEEPYFVSGTNFPILEIEKTNIALAICYELSVPQHSEEAAKHGANVYLASVAKSASGMEKAYESLSEIAKKYGIPALIANSLGRSDDFVGVGKSAVWNNDGKLLAQLDDENEGFLTFDTDTMQTQNSKPSEGYRH